MRKRILQRDSYRCRLRYSVCLGDATEVDHIVSKAEGARRKWGRHQVDGHDNLQAICSDCHKATVVGDTVGDPFKDTSGPSLNILIKLMSMVSIVMAGLTVAFHLF